MRVSLLWRANKNRKIALELHGKVPFNARALCHDAWQSASVCFEYKNNKKQQQHKTYLLTTNKSVLTKTWRYEFFARVDGSCAGICCRCIFDERILLTQRLQEHTLLQQHCLL